MQTGPMLKHFISLIIIFFGLFFVSACDLKVKEKQGPLGVEADAADLQKAIDSAVGNSSIVSAQKNQYVVYEDNVRVEQSQVIRRKETRHTMLDIKDDPEQIKFILYEDWWQYDPSNGALEDEKHSELPPLVYNKVSSLKSENFLRIKSEDDNENQCDGKDVTDSEGNVYDCIRYFNLVTQVRLAAAPEKVRNKLNCMGLPNCQLTIHYVGYDQVKWRNGQIVKRISIAAEIAQEVPDLMYEFYTDGSISHTPPLLSLCVRGLTPVDGSQYYVSLCKVLRDFE